MTLRCEPLGPVPEETAHVARAAFPKGNGYLRLRDTLGTVYTDEAFASLFPPRGQPAEAPWRLALVTVFQFAEGLSDRQAAHAVRARLDWKYALGLALTDPGFDFSVLCEFRGRLVTGGATAQLLDLLLERCREADLVKARGRQRTDSTHVLAAVRALNRLELVGETLRAALNAVAVAAPDWLHAHLAQLDATGVWAERYGPRVESARWPQATPERQALLETIGGDGQRLLGALYAAGAPVWLREVPAVETLRRVWLQQFHAPVTPAVTTPAVTTPAAAGTRRVREGKDLPPSALRLDSPYDPEARWSAKRQTTWTGYTVHVTETCAGSPDASGVDASGVDASGVDASGVDASGVDASGAGECPLPSLITQVATTVATTPDVAMTAAIHQGLASKALLPAEHLVDGGYVDATLLVNSAVQYGVDLVGPVRPDSSWQAHAAQGFDVAQFTIDWDTQTVTCPRGRDSTLWSASHDEAGAPIIHVRFAPEDCRRCPARLQCTRATTGPRALKVRPRAEHTALQAARARQTTPTFHQRYATRAGIEGTLSQGTRAFGLRRSRYIGLAKTHLQHVATAAAINLARLDAFWTGRPPAPTRSCAFLSLASTASTTSICPPR